MKLSEADTHRINAAQGWFGLGDHLSANEELENIAAENQKHPDVLELRWGVYYMAQNWDACFEIATAYVKVAPERPAAWRHRAASRHYAKQSREAYDLLFPALERFPDDWTIHYDMACYACALGNLAEAKERLQKAFEVGKGRMMGKFEKGKVATSHNIRELALNDPDLEPLWVEIREI